MFTWTLYRGKPAVYDTVSRVFYTGYRSMRAAREHADALNSGN